MIGQHACAQFSQPENDEPMGEQSNLSKSATTLKLLTVKVVLVTVKYSARESHILPYIWMSILTLSPSNPPQPQLFLIFISLSLCNHGIF